MNIYPYFVQTKNTKLIELLTLLGFKGFPVKGTDFVSFDRTKKLNSVLKLSVEIFNI